jgi:hypothetical protein
MFYHRQAVEVGMGWVEIELTYGLVIPAHEALVCIILTTCSCGSSASWAGSSPVTPVLLLRSSSVKP